MGDCTFGDFDRATLRRPTGNLPYRRALLYHAMAAITHRQLVGDLVADLQLDQRHWEVRSHVPERHIFGAWLQAANALARAGTDVPASAGNV